MSKNNRSQRHTSSNGNSPQRHYQDRRNRRKRKQAAAGSLHVKKVICSQDKLYQAGEKLRKEGGKASGIDGIRPADLTPSKLGQLAGQLAKCVADGTYRPYGTKQQPIPKRGKPEKRILKIATFADRVVAKALHDGLSPLFDKLFLDCSYGFRPECKTQHMLADLEAQMAEDNHWVIAIDDVRQAYDNTKVDDVLNACHKLINQLLDRPDLLDEPVTLDELDRLINLIAKALKGTDPNRQIGIDQGNPFSPLALNALLHFGLDVPSQDVKERFRVFRYADNLAYPTRDLHEGQQALRHAALLLEPLGLELKGEDGVVDLNTGASVQLLGFSLQKRANRLRVGLGQHAWTSLAEHLLNAHDEPEPVPAANKAVMGWVESHGPAFENGRAPTARIARMAAEYGFREIPREDLETWTTKAWEAWLGLRRV